MATSSIASLVVSLEANIAKFSTDMQKASDMTSRSMKSIEGAADMAGTALRALGGVLSAGAVLAWSKHVVEGAANLQKLHQATGSSVESLSQYINQARVAGISSEEAGSLIYRMAAALGGAGKGAKQAQEGMALLGVTSKDPATALQEVAKALDRYADGANKAALTRAIFQRSGPEFNAMLHDMAEAHQVAATVTAKQVEEAGKLEKQLLKLRTESVALQNVLLSGVVPALLALGRAMGESGAAGLFAGLGISKEDRDNPLPAIDATTKKLEGLKSLLGTFEKQGVLHRILSFEDIGLTNAAIATTTARLKELQSWVKENPEANIRMNADRYVASKFKPQAPQLAGAAGGAGAKAAVADYASAINTLQEQIDKLTGADGGFTHFQRAMDQVLLDQKAGKEQSLGQIAGYLALGGTLDILTREYKDWDEAMARATAQAAKEEAQLKSFKDAQDRTMKSIDDMVLGLNEQTRTMFMSNEEAERSIVLAQLERQYKEGLIPTYQALAEAQGKVGAALDNRNAAAAMKKSMDENARAVQEVADVFANSFADAFASVISGTKSVGQAMRDMARNIEADISRIASRNIANALFGTGGSSGSAGAGFGGIIGSLFSGGSAGAIHGGIIGDAWIKMFGAADGTDFARGGPTLVGERGPEIVNLPRGAQVIPNDVLSARRGARGGMTVNQTINVLPGASTRTASQAAKMAGAELGRVMRRDG